MRRKWKRTWQREALRQVLGGLLAGTLLLGSSGTAQAAPEGGTVAAGNATISQNGTLTTINQASNKAIINWNSFNIAAGETVRFNQPGASAIALNRVTGNNASAIYGTLSANGQVFLINPNGVLFAKGAQVNVGGLAASTLGLSDKDFLNGNYKFSGASGQSVVNQGELSAAAKGYVALLGANVANEGVIVAKEGTAVLGAGSQVNLDFSGDGLLQLSVDKEAVAALASNKGLIRADGGLVVMSAKSADALAGMVVNNSGVIEAKSITAKNGVIRLEGGANGVVRNSGSLNVSGLEAGQTGGTVKVLGDKVSLSETSVINASGDAGGGTILAGGNYQGSGSEQRAKETTVAAGASLMADAVTNGNGGTVVVWADKNTTFGGSISAKGGSEGGDGGKVETSGKQTLTVADSAKVDTTAIKGKTGSWLLDPEDFTIGTGATGTNYWNNSNLQTALGSSNITITTTQNQNTANGATYNTSGGSGNGDINIIAPLSWNANKLTLSAYRNINIKSTLSASGTAALEMTSGTKGALGVDGVIDYGLTASGFTGKVNFGTRSGNGFLRINNQDYTVITRLGAAGSTTGLDLQGMNGNLSGKYFLGADINASSTGSWNGGAGFAPINNSLNRFTGIFDGGGHTISSLTINRPGENTVGLFGWTQGGGVLLANVGLTAANIKGFNNVGGLAAYMSGGTIRSSYVTGSVTGTGYYVGGLLGSGIKVAGAASVITKSYANTSVEGKYYVGGLAGDLSGAISDSYATGAVTGVRWVGGLAGQLSGSVSGSHATGAITGTVVNIGGEGVTIGGLVGELSGTMDTSYATGAVSGDSHVGGLAGEVNSGSSITASHYTNSTVSGRNRVGGLTGYLQGSISDSYATGGVTGTLSETGGLAGAMDGGQITNSYATGAVGGNIGVGGLTGSMGNASSILGSYAAGNVTGTGSYVGGLAGKVQSGSIASSHYMTGTVSGGGGVGGLAGTLKGSISDSYATGGITGTGSETGGLAGAMDGGQITNSYATGAVGGTTRVGGLTGSMRNASSISGSYAAGNVTGTGSDVGGLAGMVQSGSISDSYATANVTGSSERVGGLAGEMDGGQITRSYATGAVGGNTRVGGLVGMVFGNSSISNSYATGNVTGTNGYTGGMVGQLSNSSISFSYAAGAVSAPSYYPGGLVGNAYQATITSSYWDKNKTGQTTSAGGGIGLTTAEMKVAGKYSDWDTSAVWYLNGGQTAPLLRSFLTPLTVSATAATKEYDGNAAAGPAGAAYTPDRGAYDGAKVSGVLKWTENTDAGTYGLTGLYTNSQQGYLITYADAAKLTITPKALTLSGSHVYDGTTRAADGDFTGGVITGINGQTLQLSGAGTMAGKIVGVQNLTDVSGLTLADGTGKASNYTLSGGSVTITKRPLTASATAVNKVYDGTTAATISGVIDLNNLVSGDTVSASYNNGVFADKNVGNNKTVTLSGITLSGAEAGNYSLTANSITSSAGITPATLTITAVANTKTYDGGMSASTESTVTSGTVYDVCTLSEKYGDKKAGSNKLLIPEITFANASDAANYAVTAVNANTGAIDKAPLTASLRGEVEKLYDGNTTATLTNANFKVSGKVSGDEVIFAGSGSYDNKNVDNGKSVTVPTYTLDGADAGNYYVQGSIDGSVSGKITARPLTASVTAANKVYDGTTAATISGGITLGNFIAGDDISASYSSGAFADKNVDNNKTVTLSGITLSGADAGNYSLTANSITSSAGITPATLTITAATDSKVYDGTTGATATPTYTGLMAGDSLSALAQTYASKNVLGAGGSTLNVSSYILNDGKNGGNYTVITQGASGTITPAPLTVSLTGMVEKVYDGSTAAILKNSNYSLSGVFGSDVVTVSGSGSYDDKNVGNGKTVTVTGVSFSGADAGNYSLSSVNGGVSGSIAKAALTLTANDAKKTYDKLPYSGGNGVSGSGFVAAEGLGDLAGTLLYGGNSQGAVEGGKYGISVSGLTSTNYDITFQDGTLTVNKAAVTDPAYVGAVQNSQQGNATGAQERSGVNASGVAAQTARLRYADGSLGRTLNVSGGEVIIGGGLLQVNMGDASGDVAVYTSGGQRTVYRFDAPHSVLSIREASNVAVAVPVTMSGSSKNASFELMDELGNTASFVLEHYGSGAKVMAKNEAAQKMLNQPQLLVAAALEAGREQLGLKADEMKELFLL